MCKYKRIIKILEKIVLIIENEDFSILYLELYKNYSNKNEYISELQNDIASMRDKDDNGIKIINSRFAPTGELQELFLDNGLGEYFLKVSEEFDRILKKTI